MNRARTNFALTLLLASAGLAHARDRGELAGLIDDPSGAAIPAASITVVDQDSGIRHTGSTSGEGAYLVPALPAGRYKVTVRKPGFQTIVRWNVSVDTGRDVRLDFVMQVGSMQEVVNVEGGPSPLNTTDGSAGTVIGRDVIGSLPITGRGVVNLLELSPGILTTPAAGGEAGQFSSNGLRANTNYFTVDGVSANTGVTGAGLPAQFAGGSLPAMTAFGSTENLASLDALEQVQILTSSFAPEFGRLPGAQVALTTQSGSEQYHASASWALRNQDLNANDDFANANGLGRAAMRLNQGSATFGGPLRKNRTFFFASYEGLRLQQPYTFAFATPSLAARAAAPPQTQAALNAFPAPSAALPGGLLAERIAQFSRPSRLDAASVRVDHAVTDRISVFGRYNRAPSYTESGFAEIERFHLSSGSFTFGMLAAASASLTNDLRANFWSTAANADWSFNPASGGSPLNLSGLAPTPAVGANFYGLAIGGTGALFSGASSASRQGQLNLLDTLNWGRGAHRIRLGADYERLTPTRENPSQSVIEDWPSLKDAVAGALPTLITASADQSSALVETLSIFAQDTWRVSSRFTLTYGFRWELTPAPASRQPVTTGSVPITIGAPVASLPLAPLDQPLWQTNYTQIAPRFGAVYRWNDRTVVRAGGGIFYDVGFSAALDPINSFPFNRWQFSSGGPGAAGMGAYGLRSSPGLSLPYAVEWNIAFERMFGLRNAASISYTGSGGRRLLRYEGVLEPGTRLAQTAAATNNGRSIYHGLELQYRHRLARAWEGSAAYTWSHALDNGSYDSGLYLAPSQLPSSPDWGSASFDVRHNFSAGFTWTPRRQWELSGIVRARTGFPIDVQTTQNFLGLGFDDVTRPNVVPGVPVWLPSSTLGGRRLNPEAFSIPSGIQGDLGRNAITGAGIAQLDMAAQREFSISDRAGVVLRIEAYNALNHPALADPVRFLDSPFFGAPVSMLNLTLGSGKARSGAAPAFEPGGSRSLQVSVRLQF
jgi:hypothetical protein